MISSVDEDSVYVHRVQGGGEQHAYIRLSASHPRSEPDRPHQHPAWRHAHVRQRGLAPLRRTRTIPTGLQSKQLMIVFSFMTLIAQMFFHSRRACAIWAVQRLDFCGNRPTSLSAHVLVSRDCRWGVPTPQTGSNLPEVSAVPSQILISCQPVLHLSL